MILGVSNDEKTWDTAPSKTVNRLKVFIYAPIFYLHKFKCSSMQTSDFHRCQPRFAKLSLNSSKVSINFIQGCSSKISEYVSKGRGSVMPAVLSTSASIHTVPTVHFEPQPSLYY